MRILLVSSASYVPPRGGSTRSNLVWLEYLASRGHDVRVICRALLQSTPQQERRIAADLRDQRIRVTRIKTDPKLGFDVLKRGAITVYSVTNPAMLRKVIRQKALKYPPDWLLVSSEDLGQALLAEAHQVAPGRVIYLAHTPQMFPFGPASLNPNEERTRLVAESAGIVVIGNHTAQYVEQYLGRKPTVIHPPVYGNPPYSRRNPDDGGLITMINPSPVKGVSIFLELVDRFPQYEFGALRGWGTTEEIQQQLAARSNITMLRKCKHIETVLMRTKVLLMPALWYEGFGLVVMEAMLRGVPVLASDQGSLVEAKHGTKYVLPVSPIERYKTVFDENRMPIPVVPPQDVEPWANALEELMEDSELYRRESDAAREASLSFVPTVKASHFEDYLVSLKTSTDAAATQTALSSREATMRTLEKLSPEKRALLLRKVRERAGKAAKP